MNVYKTYLYNVVPIICFFTDMHAIQIMKSIINILLFCIALSLKKHILALH